MSRGSSDAVRRAGLLAVAIALSAAAAAAGARLAGRTPAGTLRRLRRRTGDRSPENTYTCRCGTRYRVSGTDRHRVYWPADAPDDAPVLGDRCVECDAGLPGGHAAPRPGHAAPRA
jgi:hypothetical protein